MMDVLNTLGLEIKNKSMDSITSVKESGLLKVKTHLYLSFKNPNQIHFKIYSDSPKLDWGDASSLLEKVKFRFYQNNM